MVKESRSAGSRAAAAVLSSPSFPSPSSSGIIGGCSSSTSKLSGSISSSSNILGGQKRQWVRTDTGRKIILIILGGLTAMVLHSLLSVMGIQLDLTFLDGSGISDDGGNSGGKGRGGDDDSDVQVELVSRYFNASNYTWKKFSDPFAGFNVDTKMTHSLEFQRDVPALFDYTRTERIRESHQLKEDGTEPPVRVACLYAGFMRDFEKMFMTCGDEKKTHPNFCKHPKRRKFFGRQRDNILKALDCDVFMSTWNIRGAGRFNTVLYDMNKTMKEQHIKGVYGVRMARLHVQNYSAYQPLWRWMQPFWRTFPQIHPTVGGFDARGQNNWTGIAESNPFIRINDYSQSYKQWCALQLVNRYSLHYDLYFRLRTDLRSTHKFQNVHFRTSEDEADTEEMEDLNRVPRAEWDTWSKVALAASPGGATDADTTSTLTPTPGTTTSEVELPEPTSEAKLLRFEYNRSRMIHFQLLKVEDKEQRFCGKRDKKLQRMKRRSQVDREAKEEAEDDASGETKDAGGGGGGGKYFHGKKGHKGPRKCDDTVKVNLATNHSVGEGRIHVNDFGVGDFGFMGTPEMVTELGKLWYYCLAPPVDQSRSVYPVEHDDVSEYNLMLWYIVFSKKWLVDSGGRYLWVSRRGNMEMKKLQGGSTVLKTIKGPGITLKSGGGMKVMIRKVKKKSSG